MIPLPNNLFPPKIFLFLIACLGVFNIHQLKAINYHRAGAVVKQFSVRPNIIVFAPHPDDESLGCAGIIQQALKRGGHVRVVILTYGELYDAAASELAKIPISKLTKTEYIDLAAHRQTESIAAMRKLGVRKEDVIFLGYPTKYLDTLFRSPDSLLVRCTQLGSDHSIDAAFDEYHRMTQGTPAPFNHLSLRSDILGILVKSPLTDVYVTDSADLHPDHRATFRFVVEALNSLASKPAIHTYLVHSGTAHQWPGSTDSSHRGLFSQQIDHSVTYPLAVSWPPPVRIPLSNEESAKKLSAIHCYYSQMALPTEKEYLESFARGEEIFWNATTSLREKPASKLKE